MVDIYHDDVDDDVDGDDDGGDDDDGDNDDGDNFIFISFHFYIFLEGYPSALLVFKGPSFKRKTIYIYS